MSCFGFYRQNELLTNYENHVLVQFCVRLLLPHLWLWALCPTRHAGDVQRTLRPSQSAADGTAGHSMAATV